MALLAHSDWTFEHTPLHHSDVFDGHQLGLAAHHHHHSGGFTDLTTDPHSVASVLKTLWHQNDSAIGGASASNGVAQTHASSTNVSGKAVAPTLTVAESALHVDAGGSVGLPISVVPSSGGHATSVTITGLTDYESVTDNLDHKIFTGTSITLTAAEVNSGLVLASNPSPDVAATEPQNTLSVTASERFGDHILTSASQTITVTDPPPVRVSIGNASTNEGGDEIFNVTLSKASTSIVTVNYATADGTAVAGTDYTATSGTLTFAPGVTSEPITIHTLNDNLANESNETFTVALSNPTHARLGTAAGTGTIAPVASPTPTPSTSSSTPSLSIGNASANEGAAETFTVTLSQASTSQVTVAYTTQDGTAVAGTDYTATSGTLSFAPGLTSQSVTVQTLNDNLANESNETFTVALASPQNATLGTATGTGTITQVAPTTTTPSTPSGFYVSPNGNDSWAGDLAAPNAAGTDGPFATLARAQQAMEASSIKTTYVEAGTYSTTGHWALTSADAGTTYQAYGTETPIIEGGGTGYITATGATGLTFLGIHFQDLGASGQYHGLWLTGSGYVVRWCDFSNCLPESISGSNCDNALIDSNTFVGGSGNYNGTGNVYGQVDLYYGSSGNTITHNLFENGLGCGVIFQNGPTDPACTNNTIDSNVCQNNGTGVTDAGAFYMDDRTHTSTGNFITNNIIKNFGGYTTATSVLNDNATAAIYLDDGMSNVTVSGNISVGGGEYFVHYHGAQNIVVTNNVIYASAGGSELGFYQSSSYGAGMSGDTFSHNIVYSSGNWHSTFWNISGWNSGTDAGLSLHDNMYYSATGQTPPNTTITDTNRYLVDPQFVNVSSGNYALQSTSPAYAELSWVDIPSDQGPLPYLS